MISQRVSKAVVEPEWYYRLGKLVEVSPQYVGCVVDREACPVQTLAISIRRIKSYLELLDALFAACQAEYAFDISSYTRCQNCLSIHATIVSETHLSLSRTHRILQPLSERSRRCSFVLHHLVG